MCKKSTLGDVWGRSSGGAAAAGASPVPQAGAKKQLRKMDTGVTAAQTVEERKSGGEK